MNIFFLHVQPKKAAEMHCDQHVNKMILESGQMLSTVHNVLNPEHNLCLYKTTHINHPCTKWAMQSWRNYIWLRDLLLMLGLEYMYRFGKPHKTYEVLRYPLYYPPETLVQDTFTLPALAMPDEHKPKGDYISQHQAVHSYRDFYLTKKESFKRGQPKWTKRQPPTWWKD